jgi:hypothetical protein
MLHNKINCNKASQKYTIFKNSKTKNHEPENGTVSRTINYKL